MFLDAEAVDQLVPLVPRKNVTQSETALCAARTIRLEHARPLFFERNPHSDVHAPGAVATVRVGAKTVGVQDVPLGEDGRHGGRA